MHKLLHGDCLDILKTLEECSIDSLVTDPPAGIGFMGKDWDKDKGGRDSWIAWLTEVMRECHRVMKPGAHGLVWALPRTSHWTGTALEDAGFEVRDVVTHVFGTGFPKSRNLGKGFGTALKPASEHWVLIRKPLGEKNVAANVLKHGTGGINIDGCRVSTGGKVVWKAPESDKQSSSLMCYDKPGAGSDSMFKNKGGREGTALGRFPANLVLSHNEDCEPECTEGCAVAELDKQSGTLKSGSLLPGHKRGDGPNVAYGGGGTVGKAYGGDTGGASRFFYCSKASKTDRGPDNKHPTVKSTKLMRYLLRLVTPPNGTVLDPFMGSGSTGVSAQYEGFHFIGIEQEEAYVAIARERISCG